MPGPDPEARPGVAHQPDRDKATLPAARRRRYDQRLADLIGRQDQQRDTSRRAAYTRRSHRRRFHALTICREAKPAEAR
jgi:hypothetical protein